MKRLAKFYVGLTLLSSILISAGAEELNLDRPKDGQNIVSTQCNTMPCIGSSGLNLGDYVKYGITFSDLKGRVLKEGTLEKAVIEVESGKLAIKVVSKFGPDIKETLDNPILEFSKKQINDLMKRGCNGHGATISRRSTPFGEIRACTIVSEWSHQESYSNNVPFQLVDRLQVLKGDIVAVTSILDYKFGKTHSLRVSEFFQCADFANELSSHFNRVERFIGCVERFKADINSSECYSAVDRLYYYPVSASGAVNSACNSVPW